MKKKKNAADSEGKKQEELPALLSKDLSCPVHL